MKLNNYIEKLGGVDSAAIFLKIKRRTVYSWYKKQRVPSLPLARKIIKLSKGEVSYSDIYDNNKEE